MLIRLYDNDLTKIVLKNTNLVIFIIFAAIKDGVFLYKKESRFAYN